MSAAKRQRVEEEATRPQRHPSDAGEGGGAAVEDPEGTTHSSALPTMKESQNAFSHLPEHGFSFFLVQYSIEYRLIVL